MAWSRQPLNEAERKQVWNTLRDAWRGKNVVRSGILYRGRAVELKGAISVPYFVYDINADVSQPMGVTLVLTSLDCEHLVNDVTTEDITLAGSDVWWT